MLYSVAISDAMMEVSLTGIYAAKWSQRLDDEWTKNLAANHRRPVSDFYTRRDLMHKVCPDWEVPEQAWRLIEPSIQLPDPKDKHVLAAAIAGHADVCEHDSKIPRLLQSILSLLWSAMVCCRQRPSCVKRYS
ncbi:MAG: hypothetical protein ACO3E7_07560 [Burkholderiaceae bacterium]